MAPPTPGSTGVWSDGAPVVFPADRAAWRAWLATHHAALGRVWLVLPKKGSGLQGVTTGEAVAEALCFGWIDSRAATVDGSRWLLTFTSRKPGSVWSAPNKRRVEALAAAGLMTPAGAAAVERAKRDGSWSAREAPDALELPDALRRALDDDPATRAGWERFAPSTRKQLLAWVADAKREPTRADRIARVARGAASGRSPLARPVRTP
jgi:uncharacterized protein YdeI (YjbR/CyaY-like superfamily)